MKKIADRYSKVLAARQRIDRAIQNSVERSATKGLSYDDSISAAMRACTDAWVDYFLFAGRVEDAPIKTKRKYVRKAKVEDKSAG